MTPESVPEGAAKSNIILGLEVVNRYESNVIAFDERVLLKSFLLHKRPLATAMVKSFFMDKKTYQSLCQDEDRHSIQARLQRRGRTDL